MRAVLAYSPALALLAAGLIVVTFMPIVTPIDCQCQTEPSGNLSCPPCEAGYGLHLLGPLLLVAAGVIALAILWIRGRRRTASPTPDALP